jgi:hypothetical protein
MTNAQKARKAYTDAQWRMRQKAAAQAKARKVAKAKARKAYTDARWRAANPDKVLAYQGYA